MPSYSSDRPLAYNFLQTEEWRSDPLLAKQLAKLVDHGIAVLHAPPAIGGVLIALIVFTPETMSALRAALDNQMQRAVNLCLGSVSSTIGLTVPAILMIGLITGQSGRAWSRPSQHCPSRGHTRALYDHVLRTAHNHSGGRGASRTVLRLYRSDF
jgi:Sodium/calcium exchanger protein